MAGNGAERPGRRPIPRARRHAAVGGAAGGRTGAPQGRRGPAGFERLDDADLLALAREQPEAFGEFFERHCDRIYRHVLRAAGDEQAAEGLTGEVFSAVLRALSGEQPGELSGELPWEVSGELSGAAAVVTWLLRIADATLVAYLPAYLAGHPAADPAGRRSGPRGSALGERIERVLDALPDPAQRSVLVLRLGQDLTLAEIAVVLGRGDREVAALLRQGLIAVRDALGG